MEGIVDVENTDSVDIVFEGIIVVEDTDYVGIVVEDIVVVDIAQVDTEVALVQLAFVHHFSSGRYPSFSLAAAKVLCILFHHDLLIYKIYNID